MAVPEPDARLAQEKEEESEEESEILEESPCGRWQKRREQNSQVLCGIHGAVLDLRSCCFENGSREVGEPPVTCRLCGTQREPGHMAWSRDWSLES